MQTQPPTGLFGAFIWLTCTQGEVAAPAKAETRCQKIITNLPWKPQGWLADYKRSVKRQPLLWIAVHGTWTSALKNEDPELSLKQPMNFLKKKASYSCHLIK